MGIDINREKRKRVPTRKEEAGEPLSVGSAQSPGTTTNVTEPRSRFQERPEWVDSARRGLHIAIVSTAVLFLAGWYQIGTFVDYDEILPALSQNPNQTPSERGDFSFSYRSVLYDVAVVADYEIWGLVVSHNDIEAFGDIGHDENSVDTKDLCVIWGNNLDSNDFHHVEFGSGSNDCHYRHRGGVRFSGNALSNNHLIANEQLIRDQIDEARIGDQIHIVGALVNYQDARYPGYWRRTSTIRGDSDGGACEVIFVDRFEILQAGTPLWYALHSLGWWLLLLALASRAGLFVWEAKNKLA